MPLSLQISPELTALGTYDAVQPLVVQDIGTSVWISLRGNPDEGWQVEFWDEDAQFSTFYRTDRNGNLYVSSQPTLPGAIFYALDRSDISVDSNDLPALMAQDTFVNAGEDTLTFVLQMSDINAAEWSVFSEDALIAIYPAVNLDD